MMTNHTDLIKEKLSILDVVGSYVTLKKAGKTWKGKSPFTNEKTPSFFVSEEKGFYYCFSSGKGGDIFNFIQEIERIEFKEALALLAQKAGVSLQSSGGDGGKKKKLYTLLDDASKNFEIHLRRNKEVVEYLKERGLTKETIVKFRIGFAQDSWSDSYDFLKRKKYSDQEIFDVGLTVKKDKGGYYDRFRSRIMFPLFDAQGRIVGFSGRIFTDDPDHKGAKYVNSPQTEMYDKSKLLFGYHTAKSELANQDFCIVTEGQFDVIMAQQAGSVNTVAVSGTGLTDEHAKLIKRFTDTMYLAYDSDNAGIKATKRSVVKAYEHGMKVKVILLPQGEDPADVIKRSEAKWKVLVSDAQDYLQYRLEIFNTEHKDASFDEKHSFVQKELFDFVKLLESKVKQEKVLEELSLFVGVSKESMMEDFDRYEPQLEYEPQQERVLELKKATEDIDTDIVATYTYLLTNQQEQLKNRKDISDLISKIGASFEKLLSTFNEETKAMLVFKKEAQYEDEAPERILDHLFEALKKKYTEALNERSREITKLIRSFEQQGNEEEVAKLLSENHHIRQEIDQL